MIKRIFQSKFITPFLGLAVLIFGLAIFRIWPSVETVKKETANLNQKIDKTNQDIAELDKSEKFMQSETYLERQARLKLNYKNPDEKVVYIYKNPNSGEDTGSNQKPMTSGQKPVSVWQKMWDWLRGK